MIAACLSAAASILGAHDDHDHVVTLPMTPNHPVNHDLPWMLLLELGDGRECGAVLVNPQLAFTAAHCVTETPQEVWQQDEDVCAQQPRESPTAAPPKPTVTAAPRRTVRTGSRDRTAKGVQVDVVAMTVKPGWAWGKNRAPGQKVDDFAELHLAQPLPAAPIPVAVQRPRPGTTVTTYGWDTANPTGCGPTRTLLQEYAGTVASPGQCRGGDAPDVVCVSYPPATAGPCAGASGGPGVVDTGHGPELVGILSNGYGPTRCFNQMARYTDVPFEVA